ncbi:MAG TPA: hypothetical protein VN693_08715 [Rhodanobacteraceae bacterium]|nr:hypothetical protein [Rhodanobacteraceae bacterium]
MMSVFHALARGDCKVGAQPPVTRRHAALITPDGKGRVRPRHGD